MSEEIKAVRVFVNTNGARHCSNDCDYIKFTSTGTASPPEVYCELFHIELEIDRRRDGYYTRCKRCKLAEEKE